MDAAHQGTIERLVIRDARICFGNRSLLHVPAFTVERGERVLVEGDSGAGKSLFLKLITGVLPGAAVDRRSRFDVWFDGRAHEGLDYAAYRRLRGWADRFSMVYQDAIHSLHPLRPLSGQVAAERGRYARFRLDHLYHERATRFANQCSGGECQRLSLLMADASEGRDWLVLDEPLTDIDLISRREIEEDLIAVMGEPRRTVLLVSHLQGWLEGVALRRVGIRDAVLGAAPARRPVAPRIEGVIPEGRPILRFQVERSFGYSQTSEFRLFPTRDPVELGRGDALGMIGESGCGKSTLLRVIGGLMPRRAYGQAFQVSVALDADGEQWIPISRLSRRRIGERIQLVGQDTTGGLMIEERVGRHFELIRRFVGADEGAFGEDLAHWASEVGLVTAGEGQAEALDTLLGKRIGELSLGMMRRFSLLRAVLALAIPRQPRRLEPRLLLLDEISRGLDPANLDRVVALVNRLHGEYGVTVIAISHEIDFLARICSQVRLLFRGLMLPQNVEPGELIGPRETRGRSLEGLPNPYYLRFLRESGEAGSAADSGGRGRAANLSGGCLVHSLANCAGTSHPQCRHQQLLESNEVDVCL